MESQEFVENQIVNKLSNSLSNGSYVLKKSDVSYAQNEASTIITIENSNNVVIGNVNEFHGPVTILAEQNNSTSIAKAQLSRSESVSSDKLEDAPSKRCHTKRKHLIIILSTFCIILVLLIVLYLTITPIESENVNLDSQSVQLENFEYEKLGSHKLLNRNVWGGRTSKSTRVLSHPTEYVLISHTVNEFCTSIHSCSEIVQGIQSLHVSKYTSPDIGYNFLIGGDGNIYIGRGWDAVNFHENGCIGISFIGNFVYDALTTSMIDAFQVLLDEGVKLGKLAVDYKLVCHNQTYATLSPGENVYKVIRTMPHFLSGDNISW